MSLISKDHLSLTLQSVKKLLSFKADKEDLKTKIDKSELETPIELSAELGLIDPATAEDGAIYTDENGIIYSL